MTKATNETLAIACSDLLEILSWGRPHGSVEEAQFVRLWVDSLNENGHTVEADMFGNRWINVPYPEGDSGPRVLWSCHVDTMHSKGGRQQLAWVNDYTIGLHKRKPGRCLGADDGAGLYIMREMILGGVPGTYVFHRGEECGRLGSKHVRDHEPVRLSGFDACVAFDRKGTDNLITFQMGERGCSEAFATSLGNALQDASSGLLDYKSDPTGSYTDSFTYFARIPECTNLSVGYQREHGPNETLDVSHVWNLRCAMVRADFSTLAIEQNALEREWDWGGGGYTMGYAGGYSGGHANWSSGLHGLKDDAGGGWRDTSGDDPAWSGSRDRCEHEEEDPLINLCREYPETAAALLDALGIDAGTFLDELQAVNGSLPASLMGALA